MFFIFVLVFHHSGYEPFFLTVQKNSIGPLLVLHCILWFTLCCSCGTIVSSQEAGWDASARGGMCYHSNKLSHWQDCTIMVVHTGGVGSRCSHWAVRAVLLFLLLGWRKHPLGWGKEVQHPWIWVDGDEEGGGWKWWAWRLYFVVIYAALFVVLFFTSHVFEAQAIVQSVAHIVLVFSAMFNFGCICYLWNNNVTLLCFFFLFVLNHDVCTMLWWIQTTALYLPTTAVAVLLCQSSLHFSLT